jgi:hypothetical protein
MIAMAVSGIGTADVLELRDGRLISGLYAGGTDSTVRFQVGRNVEEYNVQEVLAIGFEEAGETVAPAAAAPPATAMVVVPAGSRLMVRTAQDLDSKRQRAGFKFTARLEGNLTAADGTVIATSGSTVYGQLAEARSSRRVAGRSEMTIVLTDVMVNNQLVPITTSAVKAVTDSTGGDTARRVARGAAVGALIDGSKGAKTGAKVGAGVSILTSGNQIYIPRGTLLEFSLGQALELR